MEIPNVGYAGWDAAVFLDAPLGVLNVNHSDFIRCKSEVYDGVIYSEHYNYSLILSSFNYCSSTYGGSIFIYTIRKCAYLNYVNLSNSNASYEGGVDIYNLTLNGCSAEYLPSIFFSSSSLTLYNWSSFDRGGYIHYSRTDNDRTYGCSFERCVANSEGGGLCFNDYAYEGVMKCTAFNNNRIESGGYGKNILIDCFTSSVYNIFVWSYSTSNSDGVCYRRNYKDYDDCSGTMLPFPYIYVDSSGRNEEGCEVDDSSYKGINYVISSLSSSYLLSLSDKTITVFDISINEKESKIGNNTFTVINDYSNCTILTPSSYSNFTENSFYSVEKGTLNIKSLKMGVHPEY